MEDRDNTAPDYEQQSAPIFTLTFGNYNQRTGWTDVRSLSWSALAKLLTRHEVGPKEGSCIVPAIFSASRRKKAEAVQIEVAFLDSDSGASLKEIHAAILARGWSAVISSTHSHMTNRTVVKRSVWDAFLRAGNGKASAGSFLVTAKGFVPRVASGARTVAETSDSIVFEHAPCSKFRIAIPLRKPWRADAYPDMAKANRAWKGRIEALAAALGLAHDQACTDTSRLFFLPRCQADAPAPETAILDGVPCDIFALTAVPEGAPRLPGSRGRSRQQAPDDAGFMDPDIGETFELRRWVRDYGHRFLPMKALRARHPGVIVGKVADGTRHHIRCPNEAEHTQAGEDVATFVCDAGTSREAKGFVIHCRHGHCDGRDRLFFLRRMLEQKWLRIEDLTNPEFLAGDEPVRPLIRIAGGEIAAIVDKAEEALLAARLDLYQRGPMIVRPGRVRVTISDGREISGLRAIPVEQHALAEAMTQAATWEKFDARSGAWMPIDAPTKAANTYLQRAGRWRLPVLTGIVNAPTLRPDGSLLTNPGYDAITGLLLDPCGVSFPAISQAPTREDAVEALEVINQVLAAFPFVEEASRSVALSGILTACIRRSLRTAPLHAYTAPAAGTGKSKLVDIASMIATGREAGVISQGKSEEEFEKRLGALLLASEGVIAVDNCEAPLGGEFLCSMLTQQVVRARILGKSEVPELPSNALITATGNNLRLLGDVTRRAVLCRLDARVERPELRSFDFEPVDLAKQERGRLVGAALTILRAYHVAGRPDCPEALGSFEEWSDWVRGALIWLGAADPVGTMEAARESDPRLDELTAVLGAWNAIIGSRDVTVREIIDCATRQSAAHMSLPAGRPDFAHPDFREALLAVAGSGGAINGKSLGKWLAANEGRIVDGLRVARGRLRAGVTQWSLEESDCARAAA